MAAVLLRSRTLSGRVLSVCQGGCGGFVQDIHHLLRRLSSKQVGGSFSLPYAKGGWVYVGSVAMQRGPKSGLGNDFGVADS